MPIIRGPTASEKFLQYSTAQGVSGHNFSVPPDMHGSVCLFYVSHLDYSSKARQALSASERYSVITNAELTQGSRDGYRTIDRNLVC